MAESELQRSLHCLDSHKSSASVCGVCTKVRRLLIRPSVRPSAHARPDGALVWCGVVCRYGLPVNFQAMLLQPNKRNMKKLREVLYELYKHLDSSAAIIDVSPHRPMEPCWHLT